MSEEKRRCACFDTDARTCYELRCYGYSPVSRMRELDDPGRRDPTAWEVMEAEDEDSQVCECSCHDDDYDDEGDW